MGSIGSPSGEQNLGSWQVRAAKKRQQSLEAIPKAWRLPDSILQMLDMPLESQPNKLIDLDIPRRSGLLSERELEITEQYTVAELLAQLSSGALTSLEVTVAFAKRAAIAQQLVRDHLGSVRSEVDKRPSSSDIMPYRDLF